MATEYTWEEVAQHNTVQDAWIVVDGDVVDITKWIPRHPGGELVLKYHAGKDASDAFLAMHHGNRARTLLQPMIIGKVKGGSPMTKASEEFRKLYAFFDKNGWFETDMRFYAATAAWLTFLFCTMFYLAYRQLVFPTAIAVSLFCQQAAFVGHDSNHHAVTHNRKLDDAISFFVTICLGIGGSWWSHTHNVHHNFPNSVDIDPDVQYMPMVAPSDLFLGTLKSQHHNVTFYFNKVAKAFVSVQHIFFLPVLAVARFPLYFNSIMQVLFDKAYYHRGMELFCIGLYWAWYGLLLSMFDTWKARIILFFASHALFGIMHLQLVLSHFFCPTYVGFHEPFDYVTSNVIGTANWSCPWYLDWVHGGLQFQIEHHIYPRMPRHRLRAAAKYIEPLCKELGLPYVNPGLYEAVKLTMVSLKRIAVKAAKSEVVIKQS